MLCPMKFFAIANNEFCDAIRPEGVSNFMECNKEKCAWWCSYYGNDTAQCAIPFLAEELKEEINCFRDELWRMNK